MSEEVGKSFEIRLKNAEGVPVLLIGGNITRTSLKAVAFTLERLANAGHYNVVLNIERAHASDWSFLVGLSDIIRGIREHYGVVRPRGDSGQDAATAGCRSASSSVPILQVRMPGNRPNQEVVQAA